MIHDIDLILLAAALVVKLAASRATDSGGYLDYVTAILGFANGIVATLTASKVTAKNPPFCRPLQKLLDRGRFLNNEILIHRQTTANCDGLRSGALPARWSDRESLHLQH